MRIPALVLALIAPLAAVPAAADTWYYEYEVEYVEEAPASRFVSHPQQEAEAEALAAYGPFRVLPGNRAALVGTTDGRSPAQFRRMMAEWPGITEIDFVECPGTYDDRANLLLGRMIRAAGLDAVVPDGGSVRSGAVELFLAGVHRTVADGAEFAVHAWLDDRGLGAQDYAPGSPEHRKYLDYYRDMGMADEEAAAFYAMTNSVPFESALWLTGSEMRGWVGSGQQAQAAQFAAATPVYGAEFAQVAGDSPRLAYLDLGAALN